LARELETAMKPALEMFLSYPDDVRAELADTCVVKEDGNGVRCIVMAYERGRRKKRTCST
jgi:hypothetical protein